jgi:hypothetical protein
VIVRAEELVLLSGVYVHEEQLTLFEEHGIKWNAERYEHNGQPRFVWVEPTAHKYIMHWVYELVRREHKPPNADGYPMTFADYVREVVKPACEAARERKGADPTQAVDAVR